MSKDTDRQKRFSDFLDWFKKHCNGKERAQGQIFFDRLFQAFGNAGLLEAGAVCEDPVKKKTGKTGFADLVWRPRVIIELKERGTNLRKHYHQAEEYWIRLVPNRPQYMVLCNFDEFWIYDLNIQMNDPVHVFKLENLLTDWGALAFLFPIAEKPIFNNNNIEVTEAAAKIVGSLYLSFIQRKVESHQAQRFVLQIVVALFSEDVNLIPKYSVQKILRNALKIKGSEAQHELNELFLAMATEQILKKPKKFKDIPYFNGGLFNKVDPVKLLFSELHLLAEASDQDWSKVRPSIFGSIFESSMDQDNRHGHGIHYTSELDIQKIVGPTVIRPLREKLNQAKNKKELGLLLEEIQNFKVLDPTCGSGNFLYIAFRELRRLEVEIYERIDVKFDNKQIRASLISPKNFFGIDTNEFGLELAKVSLCIGRKLSADEFGIVDDILPFDNLESNFIHKDSLFTKWPKANAIIGNPPFLGSRKMRDSGFSDEYIKNLWAIYPGNDFPKSADYCCYWFRKAHEHEANFIGLVGSNSITQNESRKASLEYISEHGGNIHNAISTQPWSGDAVVHVSIVNWRKDNWKGKALLDGVEVDFINSSLKYEFDVSRAKRLKQNKNICFQGVVPVGKFEIDESTAKGWLKNDPKNKEVIKIFFSGNELTEYSDYRGKKFIIDFNDFTIEKASNYVLPFEWVKEKVKPQRMKVRRKAHKEKWWQYGDKRPGMRKAISKLKKYIAMPGHSKWFIPVIVPSDWLPYVNSSFAIASDDYYLLGILTSKLHRDWVYAQSSTIKADTRYTNTTCFETFPFMWDVDEKKKNIIRNTMSQLDALRLQVMKANNYGITKLYNDFYNEKSSALHKLHQVLDEQVIEIIYGWKFDPNCNYNEHVFNLNLKFSKLNPLKTPSKKAKKKK